MRNTQFILIFLLIASLPAHAEQMFSLMSLNPDEPVETEYSFSFESVNANIPELNPGGITDSHTLDVDPNLVITDLDITLQISGTGFGGFNGDLFVTLQHGDRYAVLLNRPGSRPDFSAGYSDNGFDVTFDDEAGADIHTYRLTLSGDNFVPINGPLTGSWQPDARDIDPLDSLDSSARTAFLHTFDGMPLDGEWSLFLSDRSAGGTHRLDGWSVQALAIPEPSAIALASISLATILLRRIFFRRGVK